MKGKTRSQLSEISSTMSLAPAFMVVAPSKGICKKCSGMLNVLPYMVPVKRETQHLVAQKCKGTELGNWSQVFNLSKFLV